MSDERDDERDEREVSDNAGNQYDRPNQEVVGTDILSGDGNEVPEAPPESPEEPEPEEEPEDDEITTGPVVSKR